MDKRTVGRAIAAVAVMAAGNTALAASPASAAIPCNGGDREHSVRTIRGAKLLQAGGKTTNIDAQTERWCDLSTSETNEATSLKWTVCDYQGAIYVYNPDGSYANRFHESPVHGGCSFQGWFLHDPLEDRYAENKRFTTKWRSQATGGAWAEIGTLVD
ncbi:MAG: hypothetical protein ACSLFB_14475 [Acidimicrobiales bacterium]